MIDNWRGADLPYGWYKDIQFIAEDHEYNDIVFWILENIQKPYDNMHWINYHLRVYLRFRKEQDYLWFTLRWNK